MIIKARNILPTIVTLLIDLYLALYLGQVYNINFQNSTVRAAIMVIIAGATVFQIIFSYRRMLFSQIEKLFLYYALIVILELMVHGISAAELINELYFPLIFIGAYESYKNADKKCKNRIVLMQGIMTGILFLMFVYATFSLGKTNGLYLNSCYYLVFSLPFILMQKKKIVVYGGILICLFPAVITSKRGAFLAIIIATAFYMLGEMKRESMTRQKMGRIFIIGVAIAFGLYYLMNNYGTGILNRISSIGDDGGSGRLEIYAYMYSSIKQNSILQHIIGHGAYTSTTILGNAAHNDFLEVYWSYGIVGFISYLLLFIGIIRERKAIKMYCPELYPIYNGSIVIFIIISFISQIIFVPSYSSLLCMFWALCMARVSEQQFMEISR